MRRFCHQSDGWGSFALSREDSWVFLVLVPGILPVTFFRVVTEPSKREEIYLSLWFQGILVHHGGASPLIPILGSHPTWLDLPTSRGLHCNLSTAFTASHMALSGSPPRESTPAAHCLSQRLYPEAWPKPQCCCPSGTLQPSKPASLGRSQVLLSIQGTARPSCTMTVVTFKGQHGWTAEDTSLVGLFQQGIQDVLSSQMNVFHMGITILSDHLGYCPRAKCVFALVFQTFVLRCLICFFYAHAPKLRI